jgi:hypothetical protein
MPTPFVRSVGRGAHFCAVQTLNWFPAPFWILERELNFGKVAPEVAALAEKVIKSNGYERLRQERVIGPQIEAPVSGAAASRRRPALKRTQEPQQRPAQRAKMHR